MFLYPDSIFIGGDETRLGYVRYIQGNQLNVPCTYYVHRRAEVFSEVRANTKQTEQTSEQTIELYMLTLLHAHTNVPLSSAQLPTSFQQPLLFDGISIYLSSNKQSDKCKICLEHEIIQN